MAPTGGIDTYRAAAPAGTSGETTDPIASAQHVAFRYPGGVQAIGDLSFDLGTDEIVAVVGPSGCGKSTLLRLLAGLNEPSGGKLARRFGKSGRHGCSMVFQEDTLLPWLKVRDNVGLYYRFKHERGRAAAERVMEMLRWVHLAEFADYYPSQLSGGMRRRVAMLTAVVSHPDLLLLDEPFSALDEPTRIAIHRDLYSLIRRLKISAVLVTHDLAEAITLSDRILLLSRAPARVVAEYHTPFGADREMYDLRATRSFLDMYGELWNKLKEQLPIAR